MGYVSSNSHRGHDMGRVWFNRSKNGRLRALSAVTLIFLIGRPDGALAQHLGRGIDDNISVWRVVATLLVCVVVAAVAALVLRHRLAT